MWGNLDSSVTQAGGFLDESQTDAAGGNKQNVRRGQNIVPLMIRHLNSAEDTELTLWGRNIRIITIVGIVRQSDQATTKISYDIEDETGTITALKWLEADSTVSEQLIETNTYVRVFGLLREQSGKRHLLILRIRPVTDLNELTSHLLEVTYATLKAESFLNKEDEPVKPRQGTTGDQFDTSAVSTDNGANYGMTKEQTLVYNIVQSENHTDCGIERSEIKAKVPQNMKSRTDSILEFLVCEGHIYTTRTDDHFKTT